MHSPDTEHYSPYTRESQAFTFPFSRRRHIPTAIRTCRPRRHVATFRAISTDNATAMPLSNASRTLYAESPSHPTWPDGESKTAYRATHIHEPANA